MVIITFNSHFFNSQLLYTKKVSDKLYDQFVRDLNDVVM